MIPDYNIEFAHIYADESFSDLHIESIELLKQEIKKFKKQNKSYTLTVLVDDYHSVNSYINIDKLVARIKSLGIDINFVGFEAKLVHYADNLIEELPKNLLKVELFQSSQKEVIHLKHRDGKISLKEEHQHTFTIRHTCAILSATWQLARLGVYKLKDNQIKKFSNKSFIAQNTLTILPKKYKPVEDKVLLIIKSTKYANLLPKIHYKFY